MFELSGVNYEEVLEQGDSILVRVIASSSYRGFELSGLYCSFRKSDGMRMLSAITTYNTFQRANDLIYANVFNYECFHK